MTAPERCVSPRPRRSPNTHPHSGSRKAYRAMKHASACAARACAVRGAEARLGEGLQPARRGASRPGRAGGGHGGIREGCAQSCREARGVLGKLRSIEGQGAERTLLGSRRVQPAVWQCGCAQPRARPSPVQPTQPSRPGMPRPDHRGHTLQLRPRCSPASPSLHHAPSGPGFSASRRRPRALGC